MSEEARDIKIIGVDKNEIRESNEYKGIWLIPFKLSAAPDESWGRNFYEVHQKTSADMKRKANVVDDCIVVCIAGTDDQQKVLDALKVDVLNTNVICESNFQKKLQIQRDLDVLKKQQVETVAKLKEDSDKLKF